MVERAALSEPRAPAAAKTGESGNFYDLFDLPGKLLDMAPKLSLSGPLLALAFVAAPVGVLDAARPRPRCARRAGTDDAVQLRATGESPRAPPRRWRARRRSGRSAEAEKAEAEAKAKAAADAEAKAKADAAEGAAV